MNHLSHAVRCRILLAAVAITNLALWIFPSDVVTLIARDRHVLLGRYSREHFAWIIGVAVISVVVLAIGLAEPGPRRRRRVLGVCAAALAAWLPTCAVDLVLRATSPVFYVKDTLAYHHAPMARYLADGEELPMIHDLPDAARSYPNRPPGYPDFPRSLTTDKRGFRNTTDLDTYDIVALGDSFAEGSKVSDEHPWPVRLSNFTGQSVYNLGMSGYAPQNYLASLTQVGLALRPRTVVCMLYEENDFRAAELREEPEPELSKFFKKSPLLQKLDAAILAGLGPIRSTAPLRGAEAISWLPLRIPADGDSRAYAFSPSLLLDVYQTPEKIAATSQWKAVRRLIEEMDAASRQAGARFVLVYTPSKPHVLLPIATDLPAEKVWAFAMLRAKEELPPPAEFLARLLASLDTKETMTREFCAAKGIAFVSLTAVLRRSAAAGRQVYFTYDDHFTPIGHEVAALAVAAFLAGDAAPSPEAVPGDPSAPSSLERPTVTASDGP